MNFLHIKPCEQCGLSAPVQVVAIASVGDRLLCGDCQAHFIGLDKVVECAQEALHRVEEGGGEDDPRTHRQYALAVAEAREAHYQALRKYYEVSERLRGAL